MSVLTAARPQRVPVGSAAIPLVVAALAIAAVGAALPWVSLYAGLAPIPGFQLDGGPLTGLVMAGAGLLYAAAVLGGGPALRVLAGVAGLAVVADALYSAWRLADYAANPGPAADLVQPHTGVGAIATAAAGVLLVAAATRLAPTSRRLGRESVARLGLAGALLLSGWIHLLLAPEHLAEATALGAGFAAAGVAQVLLAAVVLVRPRSEALLVVVGVSAALLALYAWAVLVGLPIGGADHAAHEVAGVGLVIGNGEPVDLAGAVNAAAEVVGLVLAFLLLGRATVDDPRALDPARSAL